ncbi:MAG: hypothetical protein IT210_05225 [Armatimonadetes bacterium]|nr:hypothetical protein [Armatimonadota bacterium]
MPERSYEFRKRLNAVHLPDRRDKTLKPGPDETAIEDGWRIVVSPSASPYMIRIAQDFQDYLFASMNISALLVHETAKGSGRSIRLTTRPESPEFGDGLEKDRSYRIIVGNEIVVCGCDERGTGQGCYYLEDVMNLREAPFLPIGEETRSPVFSPRMVHSGWGIDQFPDPHLNAIAHTGMDAILVFVKGVDLTTTGYLDINDLIDRAEHFGVDVYLYSYLISARHPDDPEALSYYENTYGALMRAYPKAKGIVLVGESCEFPSKDTRTTGRLRLDPSPDGKPDSRPSPGWWPCTDYPDWLEMLKGIVRKYSPGADIVFWTYNWGWAPEADRLALIRALPTDVSLQATFEMFEDIEKNGIATRCVDYTVSFEGPGRYFRSEAEAARERGLRLYTMSNTAGLTWDIGVIPYEPVPFQWMRRHEALLEASEKWGLAGLMESHHYGWWPSFVNEMAKWAYWSPRRNPEDMLIRIACRDFGPEGGPMAVRAWEYWSEAIRCYVPTNEDQYGPFRVGPSYPLVFKDDPGPLPSAPYAHFGSDIVTVHYQPHRPEDVLAEIELLERMRSLWQEGAGWMEQAAASTPERKRPEASRMLNLGRFIANCVTTTIHAKRWWLLRDQLFSQPGDPQSWSTLQEMRKLAEAEIANAEATLPLVEADSRLGWEPSMEYMTDRAHLEWKIRQLRRVLDSEMGKDSDA